MTLLSLARAIENVDNPDEVKVLAVIKHLMPTLVEWRHAEDLRKELSAIDERIPLHRESMKAAQSALSRAKEEHLDAKPIIFGNVPIAMMAGGAVLGVILYFALPESNAFILGLALIVAGLATGVIAGSNLKKQLAIALAKCENDVARLDTAISQLGTRKASIEAELDRRAGGFPQVRLADVRFGLKATELAGNHVLLDLSDAHDPVALKAVDVSGLQPGLSNIAAAVDALLAVPPMLTPAAQGDSDDPVHTLFGEEDRLQDLVGKFTVNLGQLRDIVLRLHLVPKRSAVVERLRSGATNAAEGQPVIDLSGDPNTIQNVESFVEEVNKTRQNGQRVFEELSGVFAKLESACNLYSTARTTSINTIHQNLIGVLNRAAWCNRRFYCPRTIQSPQYIQDLLGIDLNKAYLLEFDDLMRRLKSDPEITRRFNTKLELEQQLRESHDTVQSFMQGVNFDQDGRRVDGPVRPRHIEDQFQEAIKQFNGMLQTAMIGSTYPVLNFSSAAQLYFDPDIDEWASNVSPYVYSTADTLKYGSVVKAYSDLMVPLWEHLWTEKADFRKSELFRTNESMIRMSEKESEKLIDIANQFRADMRTVRENVHLIDADLRSKTSEIISFRDSMERLGLLSPRAKEFITDDKLKDALIGESSLADSERNELLLNQMPQKQAEARGTVHDPIDLIREPNALVTHHPGAGTRLLTDDRVGTNV